MSGNWMNGFFGALVAGFLAMVAGVSSADYLDRSQVVDGTVVYLGIVAADVIRKHPDQYPKHERQKIPSGPHVHHVMLALFDVSSGERITDADVEARVSPLGLSGPKKRLDPTSVAGAVTYCNYFKLAPTETYVIQALIRRPGVPHVIRVKFVL